jgi:hypothetical protein
MPALAAAASAAAASAVAAPDAGALMMALPGDAQPKVVVRARRPTAGARPRRPCSSSPPDVTPARGASTWLT